MTESIVGTNAASTKPPALPCCLGASTLPHHSSQASFQGLTDALRRPRL